MNNKKFVPLITAILLFLFVKPYFAWDLFGLKYFTLFLTFALTVLFTINSDLKSNNNGRLFFFFFSIIALSSILIGQNIIGLVSAVIVCVIPFSKNEFYRSTYNYFLSIYSIIIGISAIVWILSLFGIITPYKVINSLNDLKQYSYSVYPLLVKPNEAMSFFRFCGPFDEPGVIGTINALILFAGKFNLKDKRNLVVFITGFFSLSFFYIITVALYGIVYFVWIENNRKMAFLIIFIFSGLYFTTMNNAVMQEMLWGRFAWDSTEKKFAGDNRYSEVGDDYLHSIVGTREFLWGVDNYNDYYNLVEGSASYKSVIARFGIVVFLLYLIFFFLYGWKNKESRMAFLLFVFALLTTIYQRPMIFAPEYLFMFSSIVKLKNKNFYDETNTTN